MIVCVTRESAAVVAHFSHPRAIMEATTRSGSLSAYSLNRILVTHRINFTTIRMRILILSA
jgi:hypothetical protein